MPAFQPDAIRHERLRRFYAYWRSKHRGDALPGRAQIDPLEFPWALGYVTLHDTLPNGDFRVRLDATEAVAFFGVDLTGTVLSTHHDREMAEKMMETLTHVARTRAPLVLDREFAIQNRYWRYQSLMLPFATDGKTVDMLASVLGYGGDD
ncbi:MAG: PAS domain-containing protein [Telmatospirillum sp.]|nr:PAS domain-containing protein [Telmatospirillum sp.]